VYGLLALGVLVVLISGGVDVSFPAIAAASSYITVRFLLALHLPAPAWLCYAAAFPVGLALGLVNGAFISRFRLPTLVVTLGTAGMYYGFVLFFVGDLQIYSLPQGLSSFSALALARVQNPGGGTASLHPSILLLAAAAAAVWVLLNRTVPGRGIYAIGGDRDAAERCGFNVRRIEYAIYAIAGGIASTAGMTQVILYRNANPAALMGAELDVIAAVVLGGTSVSGGKGTVSGALLGVALVTALRSSMILVGIPAEWQKVAVGLALIAGTAIGIGTRQIVDRPRN
jgi:simple sugar transport system permease protein